MNKEQALKKIEELKQFVEELEKEEWVKIDYSVIPKELFDKYGVKPFEIMKRKMRKDGEVWTDINYFDAQKECEKLGYRLPNIREMLMLLEFYKQKNDIVSIHNDGTSGSWDLNATGKSFTLELGNKEFLGIKELSHEVGVDYEWIYCLGDCGFLRGGYGYVGAGAGLFDLSLGDAPSFTRSHIGFRCARSIKN